jgi:pilus assembly protein CpaE
LYPLKTLLIGCSDDVLPDLRRELTNLTVAIEAEHSDVRSCLTYVLANPVDKRLLIFQLKSAAEIVQLERLNESIVGQPILALVDLANDPSLMIRAMRAGAAQVVRLPLQADDFRAATTRIAVQFGHSLNPCRVITVFGATEGCGITSIGLNLAAEIGRLRNAPCLLTEGAVAFGRLANYLSITPQVTLCDLINDIDRVDVERVRQAVTKVDNHLHVLTGSYGGIIPQNLTAEKVFTLLNYAKQLADVIVVDGRSTFEELDLEFAGRSQQLLLIAQPSFPSISGLSRIMDLLSQRGCLAQQYVAINRYLPDSKEFSIPSLEKVLRIPKVFPVANDWASFSAAETAGQTLWQVSPRSHALADISALARAMLGMPTEPPVTGWSFLNSWNSVAHALNLK